MGTRERLTQPITKTDENGVSLTTYYANHQITVRERLTETVNFPIRLGKSEMGDKMEDLNGCSLWSDLMVAS